MNTKNLTVLALIAVVVLTGALIVSVSGKGDVGADTNVAAEMQQQSTPRPAEGTMTGASAQTSAEVVVDNVSTSVEVQ